MDDTENHTFNEEHKPSQKLVIFEEDLNDTDINNIGNLGNLSRLVFINDGCGSFKVF